MKAIGITAIAVAAIGAVYFMNSGSRAGGGKDCQGTAAVVSGREGRIAWDNSENVTITVPSKIHWQRGEGEDVVLKGDADDLARIRLVEGVLRHCGDIDKKVEITLPGRDFRAVTIAGAGEMTMKGVDQPDLDLTIAGAGRFRADGTSEAVKLIIAGAGEADLGDLATRKLDVDIAGVGKAEASPKDDANVKIAGAGKVKLLTRPTHHKLNILGAGDVTMPDET